MHLKGDQKDVMSGPSYALSSTGSFIISQESSQFASSPAYNQFSDNSIHLYLNEGNEGDQSVGSSRAQRW